MMGLRSKQAVGERHAEPLGVVLAGGRERRMGGATATVELEGDR
jgi:molybdopterin-guanine dinucleotide biosynthesis protein A